MKNKIPKMDESKGLTPGQFNKKIGLNNLDWVKVIEKRLLKILPVKEPKPVKR